MKFDACIRKPSVMVLSILLHSSSYGFSFIKGLVFELIGCLGYNVRPAYLASLSNRKFTHSFMLGCLQGSI